MQSSFALSLSLSLIQFQFIFFLMCLMNLCLTTHRVINHFEWKSFISVFVMKCKLILRNSITSMMNFTKKNWAPVDSVRWLAASSLFAFFQTTLFRSNLFPNFLPSAFFLILTFVWFLFAFEFLSTFSANISLLLRTRLVWSFLCAFCFSLFCVLPFFSVEFRCNQSSFCVTSFDTCQEDSL